VHGVRVPRDADDQRVALAPVELSEVAVGDLLFFAREGRPAHHVGVVTASGPPDRLRMLHAPESGQLVSDSVLEPQRRVLLTAAARVVP
jgi:gamma-D-glutamyl-L-lysine dipeptidyl-peptidase